MDTHAHVSAFPRTGTRATWPSGRFSFFHFGASATIGPAHEKDASPAGSARDVRVECERSDARTKPEFEYRRAELPSTFSSLQTRSRSAQGSPNTACAFGVADDAMTGVR